MNDKNQNQPRQDSEELLVTSSTSSPSNAVDTPPTTVSTPSNSPTSTTSTTIAAAAIATTPSPLSSSSTLCPTVSSSTGNSSTTTSINCVNRIEIEDDGDDDDCMIVSDGNEPIEIIAQASNADVLKSSSSPLVHDMGRSPANEGGETCIIVPSSSSSSNSYLEQSKDNKQTMLLTMRSTESDSNTESNVKTAIPVASTPTTRSKRKLLNSEAGASGSSATTTATTTTPIANSRTNSNVNNSKNLSLDIKNHQLPATTAKRKANSLAVSINSSQSGEMKFLRGRALAAVVSKPSSSGEKEENGNNSSSSSSNRKNCVNTLDTAESHKEQIEEMATICMNIDDTGAVTVDNRKVEPLKINLHRDTKPRITIKPLPKPDEFDDIVVVKCNSPSPSSSDSGSSSSGTEPNTTNQNCIDSQQHPEPHIVPKLTIRASDCNSSSSTGNLTNSDVKHSVVPKLTIKMDGAINCVKDSAIIVSEQLSQLPPLPKLTIKTSGDTTESVISSSLLASPPISSAQPTVPKLTIKNISKASTMISGNCSSDQSIPKFTIKSSLTSQLSPVLTNDGDCSHSTETARTNSPIPKLTIKTVQDVEANCSTVPRLKIRTKPDEEAVINESTLSPTIPKFTIKSVKENEHKLTISVNDRVDMTNSPLSNDTLSSKLTVVRQEDSNNERIPKLTISLQDSPKVCRSQHEPEKLPKLTIKTVPVEDSDTCERIPKLTIKAKSLEPSCSDSMEKIPKLTIKSGQSETDEKCEKILKLTIKAIPDEDDASSIERIPKLTIKTITESHETDRIAAMNDTQKMATVKSSVESSVSEVKEKIPKLTIKQVQESNEVCNSQEPADGCSRIPKLTIKSIPSDCDPIETVDLTQEEKIPKLKIKSQTIAVSESACTASEKIPKLTIRTKSATVECSELPPSPSIEKRTKLIVQHSSEDTERIPKLTIKHIANNIDDTSSTSSPLSPKVPKLTINNHGKHLKRSGRRKRFDDDESESNDSVEIVLIQNDEKEKAVDRRESVDKRPDPIVDELERLFGDSTDNCIVQQSELETATLPKETSTDFGNGASQYDTDLSAAKCNLEMELERITSQNCCESTANTVVTTADTMNDSNLDISADLSDAAINDLVDILNDDLEAGELSPMEPDIAPTIVTPSQEEDIKEIEEMKETAITTDMEVETPKSPDELKEESDKMNIPEDVVSLGSDEDDIVGQLTELLNEAADTNEIGEQILLENTELTVISRSAEVSGESENDTIEDVTEAPKVVDITDDTRTEVAEQSCSADEPKIVPIEETSQTDIAVIENTTSNGMDLLATNCDSMLATNCDSMPEGVARMVNSMLEPGTSLLHSALTMAIEQQATMPVGNSLDSFMNRQRIIDSIDLVSDDDIEMSDLIPPSSDSKDGSGTRLKRSASTEIVTESSKKLRRDSSDNSSTNQLTIENSMDSDIMIVQESNCPPEVVPKQSATNLLDLEGSSLTGDETFRTLTLLKTINAHGNDTRSDLLEKDEDSSSLKEILTQFHKEADDTPVEPAVEIDLKTEAKSTEPSISVIRSTSPHSNSRKSTQSILLINEESVSNDCIPTDEDPLMIMQNDLQLDKKQLVDDVEESIVGDVISRLPMKRPRGRPRKDGKPAGSVKKPEPGMRKRLKAAAAAAAAQLEAEGKSQSPIVKHRPRSLFTEASNQSLENNLAALGIDAASSSSSSRVPTISPIKVEQSPNSPASPATELSPNLMLSPETPMRRPRGRGRGGRGSGRGYGRGRGSRGGRGRCIGGLTHTPEKKRGEFFTPDHKRTDMRTSLQVFEEDTRMSADSLTTSNRQSNDMLTNNNDENTQSSMLSTSSILDGSSNTAANSLPATHEKKKRSKMEVFAPEGKTEYTVDMICEYDWPPPKGCCPARNRDTFMIQEQIAQYLGIKSFKRKYPDLPRRQIDMEERNYLQEKGMVTEKMCDLGITAVWASDVLDIMYNDFYDKYEEYKTYLREKQLRDIEAKQKALAADAVDKSLQARERALDSASKWNSSFNKSRCDERRMCLDLQNLVINLPAAVGRKLSRPYETERRPASHYPIALVPGQFSENYRIYSSEELRHYPINTILEPFDDKLRLFLKHNESDKESSDESDDDDISSSDNDSDSSSSSSSDSESSSSFDEEDEPPDATKYKCFVCHQLQIRNNRGFPERFIQCTTCRKQIHPSCIEMPTRMVHRARNYNWQCADCKCCIKCKRKQDDNKMLYCEQCDRGFHIYCIQIKNVPDGHWSCERCAVCMRCGATKPEGNLPPPPPNPDKRPSRKRAKWVNEHRLDPITQLREHWSILCVPCSRQRTRSRPAATTVTTSQQSKPQSQS